MGNRARQNLLRLTVKIRYSANISIQWAEQRFSLNCLDGFAVQGNLFRKFFTFQTFQVCLNFLGLSFVRNERSSQLHQATKLGNLQLQTLRSSLKWPVRKRILALCTVTMRMLWALSELDRLICLGTISLHSLATELRLADLLTGQTPIAQRHLSSSTATRKTSS